MSRPGVGRQRALGQRPAQRHLLEQQVGHRVQLASPAAERPALSSGAAFAAAWPSSLPGTPDWRCAASGIQLGQEALDGPVLPTSFSSDSPTTCRPGRPTSARDHRAVRRRSAPAAPRAAPDRQRRSVRSPRAPGPACRRGSPGPGRGRPRGSWLPPRGHRRAAGCTGPAPRLASFCASSALAMPPSIALVRAAYAFSNMRPDELAQHQDQHARTRSPR